MQFDDFRNFFSAAVFGIALLSIQSFAESAVAETPHISRTKETTVSPSITSLNTCKKLMWLNTGPRDIDSADAKVRLAVKADGGFQNASILKSSGYKGLDKAILNMFATCHYKAGTVNGQPVAASFDTEYVWVED